MNEKRHSKKLASPPLLPAASTSPMDVALLEKLVKLMADAGLSTVELSEGDRRITLKRGSDMMAAPAYGFAPPGPTPAAPPAAGPSVAGADDESKLVPVKSPMPGTFYAAPAKGSKPFVSVGSAVEEETDVCIVEAMKVFNTLKAETRGTVARILVQDSQPVEFGQVLFLIKP